MNGCFDFQGAVVKEQGVTFAVVRVRAEVLEGAAAANVEAVRESFAELFSDMPVVLMARDRDGRRIVHGRRDIARFISSLRSRSIRWVGYRLK